MAPTDPPAHLRDSTVTPLEPVPSARVGEADPPVAGAARRLPVPPLAVLEGVRDREPAALGEFFEHYFDLVFGLVMRMLGNRAAAEDVTQDVFYKVHRSAHQLDVHRDPAPWLATIATNACRDLWRSGADRMSRRSGSIDDDPVLAGRLTGGANEPERDALASERQRRVQQAVAALPESLRVPIVLHDYQGLSHQEIATMLGIGHDAARKRYSRALTALAAGLRDLGPDA